MSYYYSLLFICFSGLLYGQEFQFVEWISEDVQVVYETEYTEVILPFEIREGYHIQLEEVEDENLLATKINFDNNPQLEILNAVFDCLHFDIVTLDRNELKVMSHTFEIRVRLKVKDRSKPAALSGNLFYQTCDDFKCYFPRELMVNVPLN